MIKAEEIRALVESIGARTVWPLDGSQPPASGFDTDPQDLKIIQPYGIWDYEGKILLDVRHRNCEGNLDFERDEQDPIMSKYFCSGVTDNWTRCNQEWKLADVQAMTQQELGQNFYTVLAEEEDDLREWPEKFCEVTSGKLRYTSLRPLTREELLECRVKRLMTLRGK